MSHLVCHLIDNNIQTAFFRSLTRCCDREQYPVMIGSIMPAGALQEDMQRHNTLTFSLGISSRLQYGLAIWRLVRLIKREGISLLHAHCFDPTLVGLIAAHLAGIPFVFTRHHSDHNIRINKKWHTWIDSWCARKADHVIAVSEATKQIMTDIENVPAHQITVVHNGMEPLRQPTSQSMAQTRQSIGSLDGHILLMIGRLHEEKGHRFLFAALPQIIRQVGNVTALLAGDGPQQSKIEAQARHFGVRDKVCFLGRRDDIPELISLASIVVLPSLAESFGFVLVEAMSFGKPVVAAATGGIPEVVANGETGLLVPQADAKALADAITKLLRQPDLAQAFGQAGRSRSQMFTFDKMISGYETVYEQILARGSK